MAIEEVVIEPLITALNAPVGLALDHDAGADLQTFGISGPISRVLFVVESATHSILSFDLNGLPLDGFNDPSLIGLRGIDSFEAFEEENVIPTVSRRGLMVLTLLLLAPATLILGRTRRTAG